jgi:rRNA maturation protein Rpf1
MDEEEFMKYVQKHKKLSEKKFNQKLDELEKQGIDYTDLMCRYVLKHPEKYKNKKVSIPILEFVRQLTEIHDDKKLMERTGYELKELSKQMGELIDKK